MNTRPHAAFAQLWRYSGEALLRTALWFVGAFGASALLVAITAWLAGGAGASLSMPALLVALALGLAVGWVAGLLALSLETLRLLEVSVVTRQRGL